jgi:hypothetical protein
MTKVYLLGSLRNPKVPVAGKYLRDMGFEVFDDWYAAGHEADDMWRDYELSRGRNFEQALREGHAASHVFNYDHYHITNSDIVVMVTPCGKSGHMEFGFCRGRAMPGFIYFEEMPERWDVMYKFATDLAFSATQLREQLRPYVGYEYQGPLVQQEFIGENL